MKDSEKDTLIEGLKEIKFIVDIVDGEYGLTAEKVVYSILRIDIVTFDVFGKCSS